MNLGISNLVGILLRRRNKIYIVCYKPEDKIWKQKNIFKDDLQSLMLQSDMVFALDWFSHRPEIFFAVRPSNIEILSGIPGIDSVSGNTIKNRYGAPGSLFDFYYVRNNDGRILTNLILSLTEYIKIKLVDEEEWQTNGTFDF